MSPDSPAERIEWTPRLGSQDNGGARRLQRLLLVGARLKSRWLEQSTVPTSEIHFEGDLAQALSDLSSSARSSRQIEGFALPIARLRASLLPSVEGLISLDRYLGVPLSENAPRVPAAVFHRWLDSGTAVDQILGCLQRWYRDVLDPWAEKHASAGLARRVFDAATSSNIRVVPVERPLLRQQGPRRRPAFPLIVRQVAEQLSGHELFEGLGPCEIVFDAVGRDPGWSNSLDLMTAPARLPGGNETFSMVAQLAIVTIPYSTATFLSIGASKRVWASEAPPPKRNAPRNVRGYIIGPGRPIFTVALRRDAHRGWQFGDGYAEWLQTSERQLPESLATALESPSVGPSGWWAGLPQLTSLYHKVSPRTAFEVDDTDLLAAVTKRLHGILEADIPFRELRLPRRRSPTRFAMLKLSDLGVAGQALEEEEDEADSAEAGNESNGHRLRVMRQRDQNLSALQKIHGDRKPVLWCFCDPESERRLIAASVEQLFGGAVDLRLELLPPATHGLKAHLPGNTQGDRERFDLRVQAWKSAAETVSQGPEPRHVLLCAPDREGGRVEDSVNYYAGLHAMCATGHANVHHLLPISGASDRQKAEQHFAHRVQSALLDLYFAHSGIVFDVNSFVHRLFGEHSPKSIFGVQAMRSRAQTYSGQANVSFLIFTRLSVATGITDVSFVYRQASKTRMSEWMRLDAGLRWLGSQRNLESDDVWLRQDTSQHVRDFLSRIAVTDSRAFVLIDWQTLTSLWKGISDDDLTDTGVARLDGKDIAAAFAQLTLVRLRRGVGTIALRTRSTELYEGSRTVPQGEFARAEPTGETYHDVYTTTTKGIVALTDVLPTGTAGRASKRGHFIQSMGYRSTVQIVRGQSCYRPRQRMRLRDKGYELCSIEPGGTDAALPAPLDITVMACAPEIDPDRVAMSVMGLRLGYAHYGDWTSLPAPLFFKRKIEDYIVRYRSPSSIEADEDPLTETVLLKSVVQESAREAAPPVQKTPSPSDDGMLASIAESAPNVVPAEAVLDCTRDIELIARAQEMAKLDFALCGSDVDFRRKQRYDTLLRGQLRIHGIHVPLPSFVSQEAIFGDRPPLDKETLHRFWRGQTRMGWVRGPIPPIAKVGAWVMQRLKIPQAGYSIDSSPLFPRASLVLPVKKAWTSYVAQHLPDEPSPDRVQLGRLAQWAVEERADELTAWLVFGCAHFPFRDSILDNVIPHLRAPVGPLTREALLYFCSCVTASLTVINGAATQKPLSANSNHTVSIMEEVNALTPGDEQFEHSLASVRSRLQRLEEEHAAIVAARQERARQEEEERRTSQQASEQQARQWEALHSAAAEFLSDMHATLPDMQSLQVTVAPNIPLVLQEAERELERARALATTAKHAQAAYQTVEQQATPQNMTPRDAARHRAQWQKPLHEAFETLEKSLETLTVNLRQSELFASLSVIAVPTVTLTSPAPAATDPVPTERAAAASAGPNSVRIEPIPSLMPVIDAPVEPACEAAAIEEETQSSEDEYKTTSHRVQHILALMNVRAYAAADVYAQTLLLEFPDGEYADHWRIVRAALEAIRGLRGTPSAELRGSLDLRRTLEVNHLQLPGCDPATAYLGVMAAGLREMLFARDDANPARHDANARWSYIDSLRRAFEHHPLHDLIERIASLEGCARETLAAAGVGANDAAERHLERLRERAGRWHSDAALYQKWTRNDYRSLHEALFKREEFPIARCLALIARGENAQAMEAYHDARKRWQRPVTMIDDLRKRMGRRRSFDGIARDYIVANIEATAQFIEEYFELLESVRSPQRNVEAASHHLLKSLYAEIRTALVYLNSLRGEESLPRLHRELATAALTEVKRLFDCAEPEKSIAEPDQMLLLRLPLRADLLPSLWPERDASDNEIPAVVPVPEALEELESLGRLLQDAGERIVDSEWLSEQLKNARDDHLTHKRLLPVTLIDQKLGRATGRTPDQRQQSVLLHAELQSERQRVTHAMALAALTQAEASRMLRVIGNLLQAVKSIGDPSATPLGTPDFPHAYSALRQLVKQPLDERLAANKADLFRELDLYLAQEASAPNVQSDIERIRVLANERSASSIRAARDMFSLLKEGALPRKAHLEHTLAETYQAFIDNLRAKHSHLSLIKALQQKLRETPSAEDPAWLTRLDPRARAEAANFLQAWEALCAAKTPQEAQRPLTAFFEHLSSIQVSVVPHTGAAHAHRTQFLFQNAPFANIDRSSSGTFIPPALGSGATLLQGIVLSHKVPDTAVAQAIEEQGQSEPIFVLTRANWTLEKRASLSRHRRVLLIDDNLVAYAAVHPEDRLQRLLRVALLTFLDNPYDDYGRPVPPEMFFGRRRELERLRQVKIGAVLYGGRRLGKSSLLDQLQRDARSRAGDTALHLTLDRSDRSVAEDHLLLAWSAIYRRFLQARLLKRPQNEPTSATAIRKWIEDEIMAGRCDSRRIYLLIDEADEVMGRDLLERGSPFLSSLLNLCESVHKRCVIRFVIAGLHNLTRMAADENSPLGKCDAIALKPFWSPEDIQRGIDLIRVPLEALGFAFEPGKEDMPLRIMAACNFYPAFIQLYCKQLIAKLHNKRDKSAPTTFITEQDLDKVELDDDFLNDIRYKFKLNLDLDKRYATIALLLADQYYSDGVKALPGEEIRKMCELFADRHFRTTAPGAFDALLDEMETLTILERIGSRYALRTPNIATLLGDRDEVARQLDALSAEVPLQLRSRGELRSLLAPHNGSGREQHVFPMPSAWVRSIFSGDHELLILVGNELSGITTLERLKSDWLLGETTTIALKSYPSPQVARSQLTRTIRSNAAHQANRRLHCIASGSWRIEHIGDYTQIAGALVSAAPPTRLALIANPARAYEVAQLLEEGTEVERNWRLVSVPPWSDDALYFHLERMEKTEIHNSDAARSALLIASCGFGGEIERLCPPRLKLDEALRLVDEAATRLAPDLATFYQRIGMPAAVDRDELKKAEPMLRLLDGEPRNDAADDFRKDCKVPLALFRFLQWFGLLQEAPNGTWFVPELYRRLLK